MKSHRRLRLTALLAVVGFVAAACGSDEKTSTTAAPTTTPPAVTTTAATGTPSTGGSEVPTTEDSQAALDELIAAAKEEGKVVWYVTVPDALSQAVADEFSKQFGIDVEFQNLQGADLQARYAAEADAGAPAADVVISVNVGQFADDQYAAGNVQKLADADLPALPGFPETFLTDSYAVVQIATWSIAYNTDLVDEADVPKEWTDITNPKFKGNFAFGDPNATASYLQFQDFLRTTYGDELLEQAAANEPFFYTSGGPTMQMLAAGEVAMMVPAVATLADEAQQAGAPVKMATFDTATGVEYGLFLTSSDKAQHPNAARLFANWILSPEGNAFLAGNGLVASVYDTTMLPSDYVAPARDAKDRLPDINKALGLG